MHIKSFLKSLFRNKTPDLSLKYILIQVHDQQGQQQEERKKTQKEKSVKKETRQKKKRYKIASHGVEPVYLHVQAAP